MQVQLLPYIEPPKQITAAAKPRSLCEHFIAFMCENNRHGFTQEEVQKEANELMIELQLLASKNIIAKRRIKEASRRVQVLTNRKIKLGNVYLLICRALGYHDYTTMMLDNPGDFIAVKREKDEKLSLDELFAPYEKKRVYVRPEFSPEYRRAAEQGSRMLKSMGMMNLGYELKQYIKFKSPELASHHKVDEYIRQVVKILRDVNRLNYIPRVDYKRLAKEIEVLLAPTLGSGKSYQLLSMALGYNSKEDLLTAHKDLNKLRFCRKSYMSSRTIFGN